MGYARTEPSTPAPTGGSSRRAVAALVLGGLLLSGCYLSHRRPGAGAAPGRIDAGRTPSSGDRPLDDGAPGVRFDGGAPRSDAGALAPSPLDAGPPGLDAEALVLGDVCEGLCRAFDERGCPVSGCYPSCEARRERAVFLDCEGAFKRTMACLATDPCADREVSCGEANGWVDCLRGDG